MIRDLDNVFRGREEDGAEMVTEEWLLKEIMFLVKLLKRKYPPCYFKNCGPYGGLSGICFGLVKSEMYLPPETREMLERFFVAAMKEGTESTYRRISYFNGYLGTLTAYAHAREADIDRIQAEFEDLGKVFAHEAFDCNEMFHGRAGFLQGVKAIEKATGRLVVTNELLKQVIALTIRDGRNTRSESPLMYAWHEKEYLGFAHGLAGILCALFSHFDLLTTEQIQLIRRSGDWLLSVQDEHGNFPTTMKHLETPKKEPLIQWCHGAAGVIYVAFFMYHHFQDESYLEIALKAGEAIWKHGVLRKGAGLCHGISGNAYSFIYLWRITKDEKWLCRAKCFALLMMDPTVIQEQSIIDVEEFTLFEGFSGALCLLIDLQDTNLATAQFPLTPMPF